MTDLTTLLGGGAAITAIIGCWNYIKSYFHKIYAFFFISIEGVTSPGMDFIKALDCWVRLKCTPTRFGEKSFIAMNNYVKPLEKNQLIAYEILPPHASILCWYKRKPIFISEGGSKITFIRGMFTYEELLIDITNTYNEQLGDNKDAEINRFYVRKFHGTLLDNKNNGGYHGEKAVPSPSGGNSVESKSGSMWYEIENTLTPIKWKREEIGIIKKNEPLEHLALSSEVMKVVDGLRLWRKSEEWYKTRQIPWKRGVLFYGRPGTGKSSIAKALAMELNMPVMVLDLSSMSNNDFSNAWSSVKSYAPCMALFEDLDTIYEGRKNVSGNEGGLSFDFLLNALDGLESADGILTVITTNNIDKIDVALGVPNGDGISTRPGRIDSCVILDSPNKEGYVKIANRILCDYPNEIGRVIEEAMSHKDTGAQFQERCGRLALSLFWSKGNKL